MNRFGGRHRENRQGKDFCWRVKGYLQGMFWNPFLTSFQGKRIKKKQRTTKRVLRTIEKHVLFPYVIYFSLCRPPGGKKQSEHISKIPHQNTSAYTWTTPKITPNYPLNKTQHNRWYAVNKSPLIGSKKEIHKNDNKDMLLILFRETSGSIKQMFGFSRRSWMVLGAPGGW